jgi:hypothetical protein
VICPEILPRLEQIHLKFTHNLFHDDHRHSSNGAAHTTGGDSGSGGTGFPESEAWWHFFCKRVCMHVFGRFSQKEESGETHVLRFAALVLPIPQAN